LVGPDGVAPSLTVSVSACVSLPLHHKVQKFYSGTGLPGWSRKKGCKTVVMWWWFCGSAVCIHWDTFPEVEKSIHVVFPAVDWNMFVKNSRPT